MGIAFHTNYAVDGLNGFKAFDRLYFGKIDVVYAAGGGAGSLVATTVTWSEPVPTPYAVLTGAVEDSAAYVTSKTALSFVLNVVPRLAANTLAGGTATCIVVA